MTNNLAGQPADIKWRDVLSIHPAAEIMPRMDDDELDELAADIKVHGVREEIVLFRDQDDKVSLLDGISRLDAATLAGLPVVKAGELNPDVIPSRDIQANVDPVALVLSLNVHRRHLTTEQKRDLIAKLIKAKPESSNNAIAKQVNADDKTVGKVRSELERRSEIPNVSTRVDTRGRRQAAHRAKTTDKSTPHNAPAGNGASATGAAPDVSGDPKTGQEYVDCHDHGDGDDRDAGDQLHVDGRDHPGDHPKVNTPKSLRNKKKPSLLATWEGTEEDRQTIRDLILEEYFAKANGDDVFNRIPTVRRKEVLALSSIS